VDIVSGDGWAVNGTAAPTEAALIDEKTFFGSKQEQGI
jgi:hypothetical protein